MYIYVSIYYVGIIIIITITLSVLWGITPFGHLSRLCLGLILMTLLIGLSTLVDHFLKRHRGTKYLFLSNQPKIYISKIGP